MEEIPETLDSECTAETTYSSCMLMQGAQWVRLEETIPTVTSFYPLLTLPLLHSPGLVPAEDPSSENSNRTYQKTNWRDC